MTMNKKVLIIGGLLAFVLLNRSQAQRVVYTNGQRTQPGGVNLGGLTNFLGSLFGAGTPPATMTTRPGSAPYSGKMPTATVARNAANAANRDEDPDLNGSALLYNDGIAANPPGNQSPYDFFTDPANEGSWN